MFPFSLANGTITRGCGTRDEMLTYRPKCQSDLDDPEVTQCFCTQDLCNGVGRTNSNVSTINLVIFLTVFYSWKSIISTIYE